MAAHLIFNDLPVLKSDSQNKKESWKAWLRKSKHKVRFQSSLKEIAGNV